MEPPIRLSRKEFQGSPDIERRHRRQARRCDEPSGIEFHPAASLMGFIWAGCDGCRRTPLRPEGLPAIVSEHPAAAVGSRAGEEAPGSGGTCGAFPACLAAERVVDPMQANDLSSNGGWGGAVLPQDVPPNSRDCALFHLRPIIRTRIASCAKPDPVKESRPDPKPRNDGPPPGP